MSKRPLLLSGFMATGKSTLGAALALSRGATLWASLLTRVEQRSTREVDAPLPVDLGHQDGDLVADVHHILDARDTVVRQLGDVDEPFLARQDLDEGAERHQPRDLAGVDGARLDILGEPLDQRFASAGYGIRALFLQVATMPEAYQVISKPLETAPAHVSMASNSSEKE